MSLLMKALEKAAKDRVETGGDAAPAVDPVPPPPGPKRAPPVSELTLQPVPEIEIIDDALAARIPEPAPTPRKSGTSARSATSAREAAQAATVLRAGQREPGSNVVRYLRERPLVVFGALAVLFLLGFGGYVYVQMNPAMFVTQAPRPAPATPIAQAPAPVVQPAANAASAPAAPAAPAVPLPLTSLLPPEPSASKEKPSAPAPVVPVAASIPATPALPVAAAAPVPATASTPRETIKVTTANNAPAISPVLVDAYAALSAGKLESSQQLYNQLLKSDPRSIDAHLGLADIASQQGDRDAASRHYVKVLELDPRNPLAQAGLIGLLGRADPQAAETRVKQLITRDPGAAYLHFTLGNTYVDQARWPDAQQAFFQAHHLQPDNPDYAYNLAVALEHIGQPKSALDFYRRAVLLAAAKGHANFSPTAAQERVTKLEKVVQ